MPKAEVKVDGVAAKPSLVEEATALSRKLLAEGQHAEHAVVNEIEVALGALRAKLAGVLTTHPELEKFVAKVRAAI